VRREARVVLRAGAEVGWTAMVRLSVRLGHHVAFACSVQGEVRRLQACSSLVLGFVTVLRRSVWFACFGRHEAFRRILFGVKV
jgi:glucuronate isomerase